VTKLRTGQPRNHGLIPGRDNRRFSIPKDPDWLWRPVYWE